MAGYASRASAIKSSNRTRRPELAIKTNILDMATSDAKSHAAASADWRRRAAAVSSPGAVAKRNSLAKDKHGFGGSDSLHFPFMAELENLSSDFIQYRRPKEKQTPWRMVLSAPDWQRSSSPSSSSRLDLREMTMVQFKHVSPMTINVNGEDITLPNRFFLDVTPVDLDTASSCMTLGELQRLKIPTKFQPMSSEDSDDLLVELKKMLSPDQDICSSVTSAFPARQSCSQHAGPPSQQDSSESGPLDSSIRERGTCRLQTESPSEDESRFRRMLNRLQKNTEPPPPSHSTFTTATPSSLLADPAILAIKIKENGGASGRRASSTAKLEMEPVDNPLPSDPSCIRKAAHQPSGDSGYLSNDSQRGSTSRPAHVSSETNSYQRLKEPSLDDNLTKGLNPATAEFRSIQNDGIPCLLPKRISRPPLTNIFPDAMPSHIHHPPATLLENILPELPQQSNNTTVEGQPPAGPANHIIDSAVLPEALLHTLQAVPQPPALSMSGNGITPGAFPPIPALPQHSISQMPFPATMSTATVSTAPLATNFGTYPSVTTSNVPIGIPTLSVPTTSVFNTLPFTPGIAMPVFYQAATAALNPCLPTTTLYGLGSLQQPSLGPDGKSNRPYFPVTTKPRDHDPVKQQMYEAYLEWRKANEPGYHIKCKMRQAQRVVRQYQEKQDQRSNDS
jgi:hypothetical protein